jgi:hypothetical protein
MDIKISFKFTEGEQDFINLFRMYMSIPFILGLVFVGRLP